MTDTPRTDETAKLDWGELVDQAPEFVRADFARTLERELNEARANLEQCRVQLAGCGVIAGCNTRTTLAEQMPTPDAYGYSASLLAVGKAVTREMNERERAERAEFERDDANRLLKQGWVAAHQPDPLGEALNSGDGSYRP